VRQGNLVGRLIGGRMDEFDRPFAEACKYLHDDVPFIIYKPDFCSYDLTVPYLAYKLNYNLVKVGLHDIGPCITANEAWYIVSQVLFNDDRPTILWIEDISVVDDKLSFINKVWQFRTPTRHIVFTGIQHHCKSLPPTFRSITWDTQYKEVLYFDMVYVTAGTCQTILHAPQTLHFRVYNNIRKALTKHYKNIPYCVLENVDSRKASLDSLVGISLLAISAGNPVGISTKLPYNQHNEFVDVLTEGWTTPVSSCIINV